MKLLSDANMSKIRAILKRQPEAMRLTESEWERFRDVKEKVLKARV